MAEEMETSRHQIESSSHELSAANIELEQRRRHIETILESIPTEFFLWTRIAGSPT